MTALFLSLLALIVPAAFAGAFRERPGVSALLDGIVITAIGGLVLLDILPDAMEGAGLWAIAALALGLFLPTLAERAGFGGNNVHKLGLVLGQGVLMLHATIDGVALATTPPLAVAVVLHQLPVGIAVWASTQARFGAVAAWASLLLMGGLTVTGYVAGEELLGAADPALLGLFEGLAAGTLLHVVAHGSRGDHPRVAGVGALAALAALIVMHFDSDVLLRFVALWTDSAPALLVGIAAAAVLQTWMPAAGIRWLGTGSGLGVALRGVVFGLPLPVCSCGVVPLYDRLIRKGAPPVAAVAFLVATPELGPDALMLSLPLLGPVMTVARLVGAVLLALAVGWFVGRALPPSPVTVDPPRERAPGFVSAALETVDHLGPWILAGLAVAALLEPLLDPTWLASVPTWGQVPLFALIGMPAYICASSATPIAAVLMSKGASAGAVLALLFTGPATNITTLGLLRRLHGTPTAVRFALAMITVTCLYGWGIDAFLAVPAAPLPTLARSSTPSALAAIGLGLVFAISLVREGPRAWLAQLGREDTVEPDDAPPVDDCCGDAHSHDH